MSEQIILPFVLAYSVANNVEAETEAVQGKLSAAGFEIVGVAKPFNHARVVCFTSESVKAKASSKVLGCFASCLRASITQNGDNVEVSWTNPRYIGSYCRVEGSYDEEYNKLVASLGEQQSFGTKKPLTDAKLRKYHYKLGMPFFNEPWMLGSFSSHDDACNAVEKNLSANARGARKVYRIDLSNNETIFGVVLESGKFSDETVMSKIDIVSPFHTAHLPVEVAVVANDVIAHSPKFRIAINFSDLKMVGNHSFASIMECPTFYEKTFKALAQK